MVESFGSNFSGDEIGSVFAGRFIDETTLEVMVGRPAVLGIWRALVESRLTDFTVPSLLVS